jgi:hypothetical protein
MEMTIGFFILLKRIILSLSTIYKYEKIDTAFTSCCFIISSSIKISSNAIPG